MKNLLLIFLFSIFLGLHISGCEVWDAAVKDVVNQAEEITTVTSSSTSIAVTPTNTTVATGVTTSFTASGGISPITWSIDDTTIGTIVSNTGVFTAHASNTGTANITATDANNNSGSTTVTVS